MSKYQVVVYINHNGENRRETLDKDIISVGSSPENDVVIVDEGIEPIHLSIYKELNSVYIKDDSANAGVFIDNEQVPVDHKLELVNDSAIRLGKTNVFLKCKARKVKSASKDTNSEDPSLSGFADVSLSGEFASQIKAIENSKFVDPKIIYLEKVERDIKEKKEELEFLCLQIPDLKSKKEELTSNCEELDVKIKAKIAGLQDRSHKLGCDIRKKEEELLKTESIIEHKFKNFESDMTNEKALFANEMKQRELSFTHQMQQKENEILEKIKNLELSATNLLKQKEKEGQVLIEEAIVEADEISKKGREEADQLILEAEKEAMEIRFTSEKEKEMGMAVAKESISKLLASANEESKNVVDNAYAEYEQIVAKARESTNTLETDAKRRAESLIQRVEAQKRKLIDEGEEKKKEAEKHFQQQVHNAKIECEKMIAAAIKEKDEIIRTSLEEEIEVQKRIELERERSVKLFETDKIELNRSLEREKAELEQLRSDNQSLQLDTQKHRERIAAERLEVDQLISAKREELEKELEAERTVEKKRLQKEHMRMKLDYEEKMKTANMEYENIVNAARLEGEKVYNHKLAESEELLNHSLEEGKKVLKEAEDKSQNANQLYKEVLDNAKAEAVAIVNNAKVEADGVMESAKRKYQTELKEIDLKLSEQKEVRRKELDDQLVRDEARINSKIDKIVLSIAETALRSIKGKSYKGVELPEDKQLTQDFYETIKQSIVQVDEVDEEEVSNRRKSYSLELKWLGAACVAVFILSFVTFTLVPGPIKYARSYIVKSSRSPASINSNILILDPDNPEKVLSNFKLQKSPSIKSSYVKNILFTTNYSTVVMKNSYQEEWIQALNKLFVDELRLSDEAVISFVPTENEMLEALIALSNEIESEPGLLADRLIEMSDVESEYTAKLEFILQNPENIKKFENLRKSFVQERINNND